MGDVEGILGTPDSASDDRIDVHVEVGIFGQELQLPLEHLQTLDGHVVGFDVVDADLEVLEARFVQRLNLLGHQEVAVRD